jgi:hypothetical protein
MLYKVRTKINQTGARSGTLIVDKATAEILLEGEGAQRKVIRQQVTRYAEAMAAGKWIDNAGGDLLFDVSERLRGGQHRLLAIMQSGVTVSFKVRWDQTEQEIWADNEGGTPWSAAAISGGGKNASLRSAITAHLLSLDKFGGEFGLQPSYQPSRLEIAEHMTDERIHEASDMARHVRNHINIIPSAVGVVYASAGNSNAATPDFLNGFFEKLATGAGAELGDPVLTVRNMLVGVTFDKLASRRWQTAYVLARAWNHTLNGDSVMKLQRYVPGTNNPVRVKGWTPFFEE